MKLSCPSYVIPGTWLENIRYIDFNMPEISNVELLFFIYDDETKTLLAPEEDDILLYKGRLTFSLHLPDPLLPEHKELVEKFSPVVSRFVVHPPESPGTRNFIDVIDSWRDEFGDIFLLENLINRDISWFLGNTRWPLCLDTGHLLVQGENPADYFRRYRDRIEEIHIHDLSSGRDHRPLAPESRWLLEFLPVLEEFDGVLNIELFSKKEVTGSIETIISLAGSLS